MNWARSWSAALLLLAGGVSLAQPQPFPLATDGQAQAAIVLPATARPEETGWFYPAQAAS